MALTSDEILVRLILQNQQYLSGMQKSIASATRMDQTISQLYSSILKPLPELRISGPTSSIDKYRRSLASASTESINLQFNTSNLAAQINDIGVTAVGGMDPLLIALQQGTQLNQAFAGKSAQQVYRGLGKAIMSSVSPLSLLTIGLVAGAAALIQWAVASIDFGYSADDARKKLDDLSTAIDRLKSADEIFRGDSLEKIAEKFGIVNEQVLSLVHAERELAEIDAIRKLADVMKEISQYADNNVLQDVFGGWAFTDESNAIVNLQSELIITRRDAKLLYDQMVLVGKAQPGSPEQVEQLSVLRDYFIDIARGGGEGADEALRMANMIQDGAKQSQILAAITGKLPGAFSSAAIAAGSIADELNRAAAAADRLRSAGIDDKRRAQIELDYRKDPIGRAGALAAAEFDATVPPGTGMGSVEFNAMRSATIEAAKETARLNAERERLNELDRESERSSGGAASAMEKYDDQIRKEIATLNAETEVLSKVTDAHGNYSGAVERARKEAELLQSLQNKGVVITDAVRASVSSLADEWLRAYEKNKKANDQLASLEEIGKSVSSSLSSAFDGLFDNASESLDKLGKQLAMLAFKMQLIKWFPNVFGADGIVPLSANADGGVYSGRGISSYSGKVVSSPTVFPFARGIGLMGEAGPEAILPLTRVNGRLGVQASGASQGGTLVQLIDKRGAGAPPIDTKKTRGPSGEEWVTMVVRDGFSRGMYDKNMKKYGVVPQKVVR